MKLSIIVPVYRVEPYLRRCIDSILAQTFRDFELILVDDGSPDACPAICDEYAEQDSRIKVIHKKNGGLSDARNAGIAVAQGEFVGFVDSDDFIHPQMYEIMLQSIQKTSADLVQCAMIPTLPNEEVTYPVIASEVEIKVYEVSEVLKHFYPEYNQVIPSYVMCKLYRRGIFDTVQFPVGKYYEDVAVLLPTLGQCGTVAIIDAQLYYYVSNPNGITRTKQSVKHISDHLDGFYAQMEFFKERDKDQYYRTQEMLLFGVFAWLKLYQDFGEYKVPGFHQLERKIYKQYPSMLVNPRICKMQKLVLICQMINKHLALPLFKKYYPGWVPHFMRETE